MNLYTAILKLLNNILFIRKIKLTVKKNSISDIKYTIRKPTDSINKRDTPITNIIKRNCKNTIVTQTLNLNQITSKDKNFTNTKTPLTIIKPNKIRGLHFPTKFVIIVDTTRIMRHKAIIKFETRIN